MKKNKITEYSQKDISKSNLLIAKFIDGNSVKISSKTISVGGRYVFIKDLKYHNDWNWLMGVVDKIDEIGAYIDIERQTSSICWWYSTKKTVFKWKEPRKPFDSVGGKFYSRDVGVGKTAEKVNCSSKIESVYNNVVYFIQWYNKNVKK